MKAIAFRGRRANALPALVLIAALLAGLAPVLASAQGACANTTIVVESALPVDQTAVCAAAKPWADRGFRVLIYLTDFNAAGEQDWYAHLDQVEAAAGLRDLSQADSFDPAGIAFEATTATNATWGASVTIGERLFGSPLDSDAAVSGLKQAMRSALASGDATGAFTSALQRSYSTYSPPPSRLARALVALVVLGLAVLVAGIIAAAVLVPALRRSRARARRQQHLETLRARVSNLVITADQLLTGATPQDTVLYRLFHAYGGERYPDVDANVTEWLRRSQQALRDAFDLRQQLTDPAVIARHSVEQQIADWEMVYVTLVGTTDRIRDLTDAELHSLLDPMLVVSRDIADAQLERQLDGIRRELAGMPLRVELTTVKPEDIDAEGVLGYIDRVKGEIGRLQRARVEAPRAADAADEARRAAGGEAPSPFVLTETQLFAGIDERLARARALLADGLYLRAWDEATTAQRHLGIVRAFFGVSKRLDERLAQAASLTAGGYRPQGLPEAETRASTTFRQAAAAIGGSDYDATEPLLAAVDAAGQAVVALARAWVELRQRNVAGIQRLRQEIARLRGYIEAEAAPAGSDLRRYAAGNWREVAGNLEQSGRVLGQVEAELPRIERLNSMEAQQFADAEHSLSATSAALLEVERLAAAVVSRLAEVKAAEVGAAQAAARAEADIAKATAFHAREDVKIGPETEEKLQQARGQYAQARRLLEAGELVAALSLLGAARQLAVDAQAAADAEVRQINDLRAAVERESAAAGRAANALLAEAQALPASAQSVETRSLIQKGAASTAEAQRFWAAATGLEDRALADGLSRALAAFQAARSALSEAARRLDRERQEYERRQYGSPTGTGGPWVGPWPMPRQPRGPWFGGRWPGGGSSGPSSPSRSSSRGGSWGGSSRPGSSGGSSRSSSFGGSSRGGGGGASRRR